MSSLSIRAFAALSLLVASAAAPQNIFPDPTFDRTGNSDAGRGGGRCIAFVVAEKTHWKGTEYKLEVEPFARYRATAQVRCRRGTGAAFALYGWEWNSFDWRFDTRAAVVASEEWRPYSSEFVSPTNTYRFYPAALLGAADTQIWVDDVVVAKCAEPEDVVAALLAKHELDADERALLVRHHLREGQTERALALAEGMDPYTRADIFCAVAKAASDLGLRERCFGLMLANAGPAYSNGMTRVAEILAQLSATEKAAWVARAASRHSGPNAAAAGAAVETWLRLEELKKCTTCTAARIALDAASVAYRRELAAIQQKGCTNRFRPLIESQGKALDKARAAWEKRFTALGNCAVEILGTPVTSERFAIVLPREARAHEQYAAGELNAYLERLTGGALVIVEGAPPAGKNGIYVGRPPVLRGKPIDVDFASLGEEAFLIKTVGRSLAIVGGLRGALYGVYTLLENYLGCGWYLPGPLGEVVPKSGTFEIGDVSDLQRPSFEWRCLSASYDPKWCVRNKLDPTTVGARYGLDKGDPAFFGQFGHNYSYLVRPTEHFLTHPEYYSLLRGDRVWDRTQVCTSDPAIVRLCAENIRRRIEAQPECKVFALCQNDYAGWCECRRCRSIDTKQGSVTDRLMVFCNRVSELVRRRYPTKRIYTYAYQAGVDPPLAEMPDPELGVQLCHIRWPCCHVHPVATCERNREYNSWLTGWAKVSKHLYVYDYRVDYANYLMPYPTCYAIARDVPYYHKMGVKTLYYQGGGSAHNFGLCHYLLAKLMWNVDADFDALVQRFFTQYYGPAAKPMEAYWRLLHEKVWKDDIHMNLYASPPKELFTDAFLAEASAHFDRAEGLAGTGVHLDRVHWERITLYYAKLATLRRALTAQQKGNLLHIGPSASRGWRRDLAQFITIAKKFRIFRIREGSWGEFDVDIRGFIERVSGMTVHDRTDFRYLSGRAAHEGQRCVYISGNTPESYGRWGQRYPLILKGGREYVASCWVKTQARDRFRTDVLSLSGDASALGESLAATTDWHRIETRFTTPSKASASVHVIAATIRGQGELWIDEVRVAAADEPNRNLVPNGNFERARGREPDYWPRPDNGHSFAWAEFSPIREFLADPVGYRVSDERRSQHKVVTLDNGLVRVDLVPSLGGRLYRLTDERSRMSHFYTPTTLRTQPGWTHYGGYEEYASPAFAGPGWSEAFTCEMSDGRQARLAADLGGLRLTRTVALTEGRAEVEITSALTNTGKNAVTTRLRVHPVFNVGGSRGEKELLVLGQDGRIAEHKIGAERADLWLKGPDFPNGSWALRCPRNGSGVINIFSKRDVSECYVCVQPHEGINLELMSPVRELKPGEAITVAHRYVLVPRDTAAAELKQRLTRP